MIDKMYIDPKIAHLYDTCNSWGDDTDFYLSLASKDKIKILDLGCGTGILTRAFAEKGHIVVGCDPAPAMLELAKKNDRNREVEWILSNAQDYKTSVLFDLIVMTGHTFQVFLTDEDVLAVFRTVKQCMSENGIFVFETRNPNIDWEQRLSGSKKEIQLKSGEMVLMSTDSVKVEGERVSFHHHYSFSNENIESKSTLRFLSSEKIKKLLEQEGLKILQTYGNWDCSPMGNESLEMIFRVIHK